MQQLVKIGDAAIEPLIDALLNQNEPRIFRIRVADTLAMIGYPKVIRLLVQTLSHPDAGARWRAVRGLAEIGDETAIEPLERLVATETGMVPITPTLHVSLRDGAQKAISQILARKK